MAREVITEGVVLRRWYAGEYDKWISLFTPDYGKLRVRVRSARKPTSKMGMLTEPLSLVRARIIEGRAQKLIAQPQLLRGFVRVRSNLERLSVALALCETLDRWLPEEHPEPAVYTTLISALDALEQGELPERVAAQALWHWLALLGYCPDWTRCGGCGAPLRPPSDALMLMPAEGVLLCARCAKAREGISLSHEATALLQAWTQGERSCGDASPEVARCLMRAALHYAESVLESPVRWLEFLERLSVLRVSG
ncbi:MAG: DNA repair protein RecO [Armatimonadota bacterium]|nr:DNA repair protein RecO [Armatimonadota bacterium]